MCYYSGQTAAHWKGQSDFTIDMTGGGAASASSSTVRKRGLPPALVTHRPAATQQLRGCLLRQLARKRRHTPTECWALRVWRWTTLLCSCLIKNKEAFSNTWQILIKLDDQRKKSGTDVLLSSTKHVCSRGKWEPSRLSCYVCSGLYFLRKTTSYLLQLTLGWFYFSSFWEFFLNITFPQENSQRTVYQEDRRK